MKALLEAIYNEYDGDADLKAALTNGLWILTAPEGTAFPYGVVFLVTGVSSRTFTEDMETYLIQFNIFDDNTNITTLDDIRDKLWACFDECDLTVSGYTHIYMLREMTNLIQVEGVTQYSITYRVEIQK